MSFATATRPSVFGAPAYHGLDPDQTAALLQQALEAIPAALSSAEIISPTDLSRARAAQVLRRVVHERGLTLCAADPALRVSATDEDRLVGQALRQVFGLGFLDTLLPPERDDVQEITINPDGQVRIIPRGGGPWRTVPVQPSVAEVYNVLNKILADLNKRVSFAEPIVDGRLPASPRMPAGARVVVVAPPAVVTATGYPAVNIRLFPAELIRPQTLLDWGVLNEAMAEFLCARVQEACGILVAGKTGSGKTTFLNYLSCFIPDHHRIVTVEDTAELRLSGPDGQERADWVRLETRPPSIDGTGEIRFIDEVNTTLRMTPDWVIVGEVRQGAVATVLLQTQISGHGGMSTIHAADARRAVDTLVMRCM
ncbi:MAG: Flp pilus assembly complex ATPase component TadA, partial [Chloroflexi bacterium]|nr:Flp pilus assembly complex ATPase component TadA [Chloroflexota bacterium]